MEGGRILLVEDDPDGAEVLEAYLRRDGFECRHVLDGHAALKEHAAWKPDLVLLDVMLPGLDGNQVLSAIRQHAQTPVIMVTAVGQHVNRVNSLLYGADDYVVKPYHPGEVVARVHAVLRRFRAAPQASSRRLRHESLVVDLDAGLATVQRPNDGADMPLELTRMEFSLLAQMMNAPHKTFTRAELLESCHPDSSAMERVVDAHVYNLRRKLEQVGVKGVLLTVRGMGYRFQAAPA
ncbi:MAG: response regulator transcription factor [Lautropia sp.]|nr:response regulator transcription factor [Lautropia sp.]